MKVSIITPTQDRAKFLEGLYHLLLNQTHKNWEWLIYDTSLHAKTFSDSRVNYFHSDEILSVGEKRNRLIKKSSGDIIVHCDDDDFYAPNYLEWVISNLQEAHFCMFKSWFCYDLKTNQMFYNSLSEKKRSHYIINALSGYCVREVFLQNDEDDCEYGLSCSYRAEVAKNCFFPDCDLREDYLFFQDVKKAGFSITAKDDHQGRFVHIIHDTNSSSEYPHYRLPHFLISERLSPFFTYIGRYNEN